MIAYQQAGITADPRTWARRRAHLDPLENLAWATGAATASWPTLAASSALIPLTDLNSVTLMIIKPRILDAKSGNAILTGDYRIVWALSSRWQVIAALS
jgi:hypothetical protein